MKKYLLIPILLSFVFTSLLTGQNKKIIDSGDLNEKYITTESGLKFTQSDILGQVLVSDIKSEEINMRSPQDFLLFPGYPMTVVGNASIPTNSFEGAIFCNMDDDAELEFVINIAFNTYAFNPDSTIVPGWPKTITQATIGSPAFGDIDGDGVGEIVIGSQWASTGGKIYAYERDGTLMPGFPIAHGNATRSPALGDLNNDGSMEILMGKRTYPTGQVYAYKGDGTVLTGWPQNIATVPAASAAIGDITGDNNPEVIYEALNSIYAWDGAGNLLPGFPFLFPVDTAIASYSSPVLADLNNDGKREIIFGLHESAGALRGVVYVLKSDGTIYPGWPQYTTMWIYGPPAVGYIDGDNILDIAVGEQVLSTTPACQITAWNANGQLLTGFPSGLYEAINSQVIIADIDADNLSELIFDDNTYVSLTGKGKYLAVNHDGTMAAGFPLQTQGTTFFMAPVITDINLDGTMDMYGSGQTRETSMPAISFLHLWNTQVPYNGNKIYVPMFQYNSLHNGIYDQPQLVPVELTSFTADVTDNNVQLNWTTVTETNNSGFEIERKINKSGEWLALGFTPGAGTTTELKNYSFNDNNLTAGSYIYRLKQIDYDGTVSYSEELEVTVGLAPVEFSLSQNYPNPFNPSTIIKYSVPFTSSVQIKVFNMLGESVSEILNEVQNAGYHEVTWNASDKTSGIYFYSIEVKSIDGQSSYKSVKKMIYLR